MSKKWLIVVAALVLVLSSVACDDSDLVGEMQDHSTGGQEALDKLDEAAEDLMFPEPISYPSDEDVKEALEEAILVVEDIAENSGAADAAKGGALTLCVVGCDAMYGPLAPVFSDADVFDACVANCQQ